MDITYMPKDVQTKDNYILVIVDCFTKFAWTRALKNRDADSVLKVIKELFPNGGFSIFQILFMVHQDTLSPKVKLSG